ncbi:demethoxyubiquinone hydroxylase family protein [Cochlodiniinecator piscidefendens]|uniref:demethoxyubiquinone hydroxylase family protein n=1 Tax=Cochlodiniinecator piscidefendens TaxID=2715756 RepID=UPI00140E4BFC|nr:demethoxyubiquinone hydroxylase family protein [Cochlodiniinecator piscidefendens]
MTGDDEKTIRRILKVNHAGEHGAIRIYKAQLWVARRLYPDIVGFLDETLHHEIEHCALFYAKMPTRQTRPCRVMSLWAYGGYLLGFATSLFGRQGIWVCTAAVEETVHRHLLEQLDFLKDKDPDLAALINSIKDEELHHLHHAEANIIAKTPFTRGAIRLISNVTEILIWLSTWGDSTRMKAELAHRG